MQIQSLRNFSKNQFVEFAVFGYYNRRPPAQLHCFFFETIFELHGQSIFSLPSAMMTDDDDDDVKIEFYLSKLEEYVSNFFLF